MRSVLRSFGTALVVVMVAWGAQPAARASDFDRIAPELAGWESWSPPDRTNLRLRYLEIFYRQFAEERALAASFLLPYNMEWNVNGWRKDVVPFAGDYVGRPQIRELFQAYFAAIDIKQYVFEYKLAQGDYVSWHFRLIGQVPSTGKTFDMEVVHVWRFGVDGRPAACRVYYDTQLMIDAFTPGGSTFVTDRKNPNDDFRIVQTPYDVQSLAATLYDNFYAGNLPAVFAMLAEDVYIYFQGRDNPQSGEYHGMDGLMQFIMNLAGTAYAYDINRFYVTEGDRTDIVLFENWTVYSTGKSYHVHTVNSWRVNAQGKLMGFINYPDIDEVAAAYVP